MISTERKQEIKDLLVAFGLAMAVHLGFLLILIAGSWNWQPFEREAPPVRVSLVDMAPMVEQRRAEEQAEQQAEQERQQAEQQRQQEIERQRQQEVERERQAELERQREQEQRRQEERERRERELEQQRAEAAERERRQEELRRRQAEQQRAEEERRREEEERLRELAELREQREEARRRREQEEQRMAELAERRAAEQAEREAAEEAERLRLAREQADAEARRATLGEEYVETIRELVRRNWNRPPTTQPGVLCRVRVVQIPGGEIIAAEIVRPCNADQATRRSITAAVMRVGELPYRGYESVFAREIDFDFRYDG